MAASPFALAADGVRIALRVTPGAPRDAIAGLKPDADGGVALCVKVTAAPEDGRANAAVVKFLARTWRKKQGDLEVVSGATARRKQVLLRGPGAALMNELEVWLAEHVA